jgi:hypothetical protein
MMKRRLAAVGNSQLKQLGVFTNSKRQSVAISVILLVGLSLRAVHGEVSDDLGGGGGVWNSTKGGPG